MSGCGRRSRQPSPGRAHRDRGVGQRIALERSLLRKPTLRQALREKRISYEKARLIAGTGNGGSYNNLVWEFGLRRSYAATAA